MKFMIEFHLRPGVRNQVVDEFEKRGPNRQPGVEFCNAWIGLHTDVIFALAESETEALVAEACRSWSQTGNFEVHPVINIEQF